MTQDQQEILEKAHRSLSAATILLQTGFPEFAASRAYYTMFYVAQAFLEGEGLSYSKHSAVIAAFGQYFAHTGKVPVAFHRLLIDAQRVRHAGDYETHDDVTIEQAQEQIDRAQEFLDTAEQLMGPLPPTS